MKRLLLLGGGHSHLAVLKSFGAKPPDDTELTLISQGRYAAYFGMLPGLIIWITGASANPLLARSGAQVDERGFIAINAHLQSLSHSEVFAAGDSATLIADPHPKSGVYAVRHGPVLAENLRRAIDGRPLASYTPQRKSLALISAGGKYAVATRGDRALEGAWVWRWKDWIDRRFVNSYR